MAQNGLIALVLALLCAMPLAGCSASREPLTSPPGGTAEDPLPPPAYELTLTPEMRSLIDHTLRDDLDGIARRRFIRADVPFNRTYYLRQKAREVATSGGR